VFFLPGTEDIYGVSLDVFCLPKGAKHPETALKWLKVLVTPECQAAFAAPKGFIPARTDAVLGPEFSDYQKASMERFKSVKYYRPGMWSGTPPAFMTQLTDIISDKIGLKRDPAAAAAAIAALQASTQWPITWDLGPKG